MLSADLDLEPINLSDQCVLTYLAGDIFPEYAGSLPPGTAGLGLGFRLGFLQFKTFIPENKLNGSKCSEGVPKILHIREPTFDSVSQIRSQIWTLGIFLR